MKRRPRRLIAYRPRRMLAQSGLGLESIEAWPAAGGGLLVGVAEAAFAGAAALRPAVKTLFIRVDDMDGIIVLLPYVTLENEARACVLTLVAEELSVPECNVEIRDAGYGHPMVDIGRQAERSLQSCAAVVRTLLISAAAENWSLSPDLCHAAQGLVRGLDRTTGYGDVAADAALAVVPDLVRLRCGHHVSLTPAEPVRSESLAVAD